MVDLLTGTIRTATPILLAALGGLICERAGIFNIALEGLMLFGAFFGIFGRGRTDGRTDYIDFLFAKPVTVVEEGGFLRSDGRSSLVVLYIKRH